MTAPRRAYGQARVRARSATIIGADAAKRAAATPSVPEVPGWRDLDPDDDGSDLLAVLYARLLNDYQLTIRAYPEAAEVLRALAHLHEMENVKLLWRAAMRALPAARWRPFWRPLGWLARVHPEPFTAQPTLPQVVSALARTPMGAAAATVWRVHGDDLAAAEIAWDRLGSAQVAAAAAALPRGEQRARDLAMCIVQNRDARLFERMTGTMGFAPQDALRMSLSGKVTRLACGAACRRAFVGDPFSLALPVALVLMREEETRILTALAEWRARHAPVEQVHRAIVAIREAG